MKEEKRRGRFSISLKNQISSFVNSPNNPHPSKKLKIDASQFSSFIDFPGGGIYLIDPVGVHLICPEGPYLID